MTGPRAFFEWLAATPVSVAFNGASYWYFGVAMAVHLLGIALLAGTSLAIGLRVLGWRLRTLPAERVSRALSPWFWRGLAIVVPTGLWLLVADPLKYFSNPAFRIKVLLLLAALIAQWALLRHATAGKAASASAPWKLLALATVALWFGTIAAGRIVGLL